MVLGHGERSDGHLSASCANEFQSYLDKFDLVDLPLKGGKWTWSNKREKPSFSIINQFLISSDLVLKLSGLNQKVFYRPISNHFPILLDSNGIQWGPSSFRIDNKWFKNSKFREMIAYVWNSTFCNGTVSFIIATKLSRLKNEIKSWTKKVGRAEESRINDLMAELDIFDNIEGAAGLSMLTGRGETV